MATTVLLGAAPTAFERIGWKFWIVLIGCCVFYGILVWLFLHESKGKTLEEITLIFGDPVGLTDIPSSEGAKRDEEGKIETAEETG